MFMGEYQHNLDTKGRIIIPAKFRDELGDTMVVTRWLDGCLAIYTMEQWQALYEKLQTLPATKREARRFTHMIMAKASECNLDSQGRIRLPAPLIKEASLEKECVVIGVSDHVEIWNKERWDEYYEVASESFEDIAESLTEFF
ncbi:MAG: division/cell wall cluster transcriptional repressor MraZ [Erysipelothrix sp.]|nr:division/cell wall cluster transcriptional repressor MraZ [Erysipelothrix sp.]